MRVDVPSEEKVVISVTVKTRVGNRTRGEKVEKEIQEENDFQIGNYKFDTDRGCQETAV